MIHLKWVLVKIDWVIELQRINKDSGYDYVSMLTREINERSMTLVQSAHCGNHGNRLTIYSTGVNSLTEFLGSTKDVHNY